MVICDSIDEGIIKPIYSLTGTRLKIQKNDVQHYPNY